MLLSKAITQVLNRTGLSVSNEALRTQARDYISLAVGEMINTEGIRWRFLDRTNTFTTVSGTRSYTPETGNVAAWHSFVDQTNGRPLEIIGADDYDLRDPEHDDSGTIEAIYIGGIDPTADEYIFFTWRTPSNSTTVIRYRYRADIPDFAASDDTSTFLQLGLPRIAENVAIFGATALYLEEEGDTEQADRDSQRHSRSFEAAKRANGEQQGNRTYPPIRNRSGDDSLVVNVGTGLVTGA